MLKCYYEYKWCIKQDAMPPPPYENFHNETFDPELTSAWGGYHRKQLKEEKLRRVLSGLSFPFHKS